MPPVQKTTKAVLPKAEVDPLDPVIHSQKRITLVLADREIAEFFQGVVGESPRLSVRKVDALPGQFLIIYAENTGDFAELRSIVDVSIRSSVRRLTLSPDDMTGEAPGLEGLRSQATGNCLTRATFDDRMVVGMPLNIALAVFALACAAGAFTAWLSLALGEFSSDLDSQAEE